MNTRFLYPLFFLLLLFTLGSCDKNTPVPAHTKAWLHDADGDVLTFRNASTGTTETLLVQRQNTSKKFGGETLEIIKLTYASQQDLNAGLRLDFDGDGYITVQPHHEWTGAKVSIRTGKPNRSEGANGDTSASALYDDNVRLNQRDYAIVVLGAFNFLPSMPNAPQSPNTLRDFWYSKNEGLVAYTKTDGQTWHRVW